MLKGIDVVIHERTLLGVDSIGAPTYAETSDVVHNVLVAPVSVPDQTAGDPVSRKVVYQLGIPKGDSHAWTDCRVEFFGQLWQSFGCVEQGISELVPGPWDRKVQVALYEG